jgi:hypothetical protein
VAARADGRGGTRSRRARLAQPLSFLGAQFHPADLAGDRLGHIAELQPADPLVRGQPLPGVAEDRQRGPGRVPGGDHVEPAQGPVELIEPRPGELGQRGRVVLAVAQQQVPGVTEGLRR